MGSKSSPSPPAPPDPERTAAAQAAANKEAAVAAANINMVNQYTPYGSLEYSPRGTAADGTPQYSATQTLSPDQQILLDQGNQAAQKFGQTANTQLDTVSGALSNPINYDSLGPAPVVNEETRQNTQQAIVDRNQPFLDRRRDALETRLANQGFNREFEGFIDQFDQYNRGENDFLLGADAQAGDEMARMYGLEQAQRNAGINEIIQQRQIPLNELSAMLTQSQVQGPQFTNTPQQNIDPADIMGATYGGFTGLQNNYNSELENNAANRQGLYGLIGSGLKAGALAGPLFGFSDRRLKTCINRVGSLPSGLPVYTYFYRWGGPLQVGVMADEAPRHVVVRIGEYDAVNYGRLV